MNTVTLSGNLREHTGTKHAAQLRREKRVPCVLYGGGRTIHFSVDEAALGKLVFTPEVNGIELDLDGTKTLAIVHEKQFHPLTDRVTHVDFMELKEDQETRALLSIRLQGQAIGVRNGGQINQTKRKLRVKGLPVNIPQHLDLDVTGLGINDSVRVEDLEFKGLTLLERPGDVVVSVKTPKKVEAAAVAETAAGATTPAAAEAKPAAKK